jgi:hypothetical protein
VPRRKGLKGFARLAMLEIGPKYFLHRGVNLVKGKGLIDLPSTGSVISEAAANKTGQFQE